MISIKDIDMAVIVGMNDQTIGMTIWALKMIKIQRKNNFIILSLRDILDFFESFIIIIVFLWTGYTSCLPKLDVYPFFFLVNSPLS